MKRICGIERDRWPIGALHLELLDTTELLPYEARARSIPRVEPRPRIMPSGLRLNVERRNDGHAARKPALVKRDSDRLWKNGK